MPEHLHFELATRDKMLNKIEQLIAQIKREYGHAHMKEDSARIRIYGRRLWRLEDLRNQWRKAYINSRGL